MATLHDLLAALQTHTRAFDEALAAFDAAREAGTDALAAIRNQYAGRKTGLIASLMERLSELPPADRKEFGKQVNAFKSRVEQAIATREAALAARRRPPGSVDVTLAGRRPLAGSRHPLSLVREQVQEIFTRLGYQVLEGPEIEDDYHNFEALNMPQEHPARDMQDTLYLSTALHRRGDPQKSQNTQNTNSLPGDPQKSQNAQNTSSLPGDPQNSQNTQNDFTIGDQQRGSQKTSLNDFEGAQKTAANAFQRKTPVNSAISASSVDRSFPLTLLRTHTSAMQIRHMENNPPPVRLIAIGPVYRRDNLDLTHTPMFHQCEGLVVGPNITLADLKGTLLSMARALFGPDQEVRFRPSFFPYTEPSAEVDIRCIRCGGHGCPICKRTGWLEILGSGMVHPAVFEYVGYDPDEVTGFAFGMGLERVAMLKWDVDDIRLFYENDLRFLEQFGIGLNGSESR